MPEGKALILDTTAMSITKPETLPKPIQRALNQIAHSRHLI
ncbi:hypothetical protein PSYJA_40585, partial [Pseudomonas syringae pv. japonica str. M301072]